MKERKRSSVKSLPALEDNKTKYKSETDRYLNMLKINDNNVTKTKEKLNKISEKLILSKPLPATKIIAKPLIRGNTGGGGLFSGNLLGSFIKMSVKKEDPIPKQKHSKKSKSTDYVYSDISS